MEFFAVWSASQDLYCAEQVQQKRQHRPYHVDGPSNGGDIIIGMTISESRMLGFKVTTARDGVYVQDRKGVAQDGRHRSSGRTRQVTKRQREEEMKTT